MALETIRSATGQDFVIWSRDSGIHWDISVDLKDPKTFDAKNAEHVECEKILYHARTKEEAEAIHAKLKDAIVGSKILPDDVTALKVMNEGRKELEKVIAAKVAKG